MYDQDDGNIPDEDLVGSAPFDPDYRFRGENGSSIVNHVLELMAQREVRQRRLRGPSLDLRYRTVEALLANLAVSALHSLNPDRPVAVTFHKPRYPELGLSHKAMTLARDVLIDTDLIAYRAGYYERPTGKYLSECRRASRLRASAALYDLFRDFGIDRRSLLNRPKRLVKLNKPDTADLPEPGDVTASEVVLTRINARIEASELSIPDEIWTRMRVIVDEDGPAEDPTRFYRGDQTAKTLRRVFTYDWQQGGRLYGGWWQGLTSSDRKALTIDGTPTVEIDFKNLHPLLLFRLTGNQLDIDPYELPPYSRELCKETFQRLLNRTPRQGGTNIKRPGVHCPPDGLEFGRFLDDYKQHLGAVAKYFGHGIGLHLQREDSDLALAILDSLDCQGVTALPVHDSFIVKAKHGGALDATMHKVFVDRYGIEPELKWSNLIRVSQLP